MKKKLLLFFILGIVASLSAKEYHVSKKGNDSNDGSISNPFQTISRAVNFAYAGDTITVHKGTYREQINPIRGGNSDAERILYRAMTGANVEIKGSEIIKGWKKVKNSVWKVVIPSSFFGDYNPYQDSIFGDWFNDKGRKHHTGEVFINGKSLYEKETVEKVLNPIPDASITDPQGSIYTWYCQSNDDSTTIWANFHEYNPDKELVEISTRRTCFYPNKPGINYITIRGFHFSQAATQWGAPTAEQVGMIATHWNKGWIIEDNVISDSKCSGITLGKDRSTGHNVWSADADNVNRDGNIHYIEVIFNVLRNNWDKEHVGSHIVRNNTIFNCEQTAICGSMGAVFSTIENNHIYNIYTKRQFIGAEISGIKFHAPIDVVIKNNRIHDCPRGIWLDWMTQGTRVTGNLIYDNDWEDLFIEVNHGPYIVDNNILLSQKAITNWSQGGAFVHNLIGGKVVLRPIHERFTPYFLPHSIDIAGLTTIWGGDDRFYNNIITSFYREKNSGSNYGLSVYDTTKLSSSIVGNIYLNKANPSAHDLNNINYLEYDPKLDIIEKGDDLFLHFSINKSFVQHLVEIVSTTTLGKTKISKAKFDNPDGSELIFDIDYYGNKRSNKNAIAGPFSELNIENKSMKIWKK